MKIKASNSAFEPCPEFSGRAVCVDVTPLRKQQGQFGEREVFRLVFEVDMERDDGSRFCVWSRSFTPTLNEKSNLRRFLRGWFGRDLGGQELGDFDTESLIGRPAQVLVVNEHKGDKVYSNIAACTPEGSGEPLKASGNFVRAKDRGRDGNGGYRTEQPASDSAGLDATKVHVGRCKGLELRDLATEEVQALMEDWLPAAKANPRPLADDKRLMAALDWWAANNMAKSDDNNIPY